MRRWSRTLVAVVSLIGWQAIAAAQIVQVVPTTTLAAETGNNTSAADSFVTQTNGNAGVANVSKAPLSSLLYPGSTTKLYAHFMPWFGGANHMNVGYRSDDPIQVRKQVDDMMSRGLQGAIIDWYGPSATREQATTVAMQHEAELRGGAFEFAIMEDVGALSTCANTPGCDLTTQLISDLTFVYTNFESSPAYMRMGGRPVVFFFGLEQYTLDWTRVRALVPGSPLFIFRNAGAFSQAESDGGFAWIDPLTSGSGYLDFFYRSALAAPTSQTFASAYKGFNDSLAAWAPTPPRVLAQDCGQTWLATLAEIGRYYNTTNQLPALQLVTWNDYEEGTELESGIENCVTVSGAVSGTNLTWSITGNENTVNHYTVFISTDGSNLARLAEVPVTAHSYDLSALPLSAGTYQLYVRAVGKPSMRNHFTPSISYTIAPAPPSTNIIVALAATPTTLSLSRGQSASVVVSLSAANTLGGAVSFGCANLPAAVRCSFGGLTANADGSTSATLTLTTGKAQRSARSTPEPTLVRVTAEDDAVTDPDLRQRGRTQTATKGTAAITQSAFTTPPGDYSVSVTATAGTTQLSTGIMLTVR